MKSLEVIMKWANDLFPLCRSITGEGLRKSLKYLKKIVPEMKLKNVKSGEKFFDWEIPLEWNINDSYIYHIKSKKKFAEFSKNNLHIMGYSEPINKKIKFDDLKKKIFFNKKYPTRFHMLHLIIKEIGHSVCLIINLLKCQKVIIES